MTTSFITVMYSKVESLATIFDTVSVIVAVLAGCILVKVDVVVSVRLLVCVSVLGEVVEYR